MPNKLFYWVKKHTHILRLSEFWFLATLGISLVQLYLTSKHHTSSSPVPEKQQYQNICKPKKNQLKHDISNKQQNLLIS